MKRRRARARRASEPALVGGDGSAVRLNNKKNPGGGASSTDKCRSSSLEAYRALPDLRASFTTDTAGKYMNTYKPIEKVTALAGIRMRLIAHKRVALQRRWNYGASWSLGLRLPDRSSSRGRARCA